MDLLEGGGGVFDVAVDGKAIYSKHNKGGFPETKEIVKEIKRRGDP